MTSLHYDPYGKRSYGYDLASTSAYGMFNSQPKPPSGSSVISGIKSIFCAKKVSSSVTSDRFGSSVDKTFSNHISLTSPSYGSLRGSSAVHASIYPRRSLARIKTSDTFPVLSPQLEDRMLQLADRSRRLGVHRFSRTRNALILNQHTSSIHRQVVAATPTTSIQSPQAVYGDSQESFTRAGSTTSLSTLPSTPYRGGIIQKVSLPGLGLPHHTGVRE
jgi:hypothetical protein